MVGTAPAAAVERVEDGGFDGSLCIVDDCTNPAWDEAEFPTGPTDDPIGPICKGGVDQCESQGSGYTTAPNWVRLGAMKVTEEFVTNTSRVSQLVPIPAGPATLRFALRLLPGAISEGSLEVSLDGTNVFVRDDNALGFQDYAQVVIDVSAFAGDVRLIRFSGIGHSNGVPGSIPPSFDIDDVSLDAPNAPPQSNSKNASCAGRPATIVGSSGADRLTGTPGTDVIAALGGNDRVSGLAGNDVICGGAGKDTLKGGKGNDKLLGQAGKDKLLGGPGRDKLRGGPGKDTLKGGPGRDKQVQ